MKEKLEDAFGNPLDNEMASQRAKAARDTTTGTDDDALAEQERILAQDTADAARSAARGPLERDAAGRVLGTEAFDPRFDDGRPSRHTHGDFRDVRDTRDMTPEQRDAFEEARQPGFKLIRTIIQRQLNPKTYLASEAAREFGVPLDTVLAILPRLDSGLERTFGGDVLVPQDVFDRLENEVAKLPKITTSKGPSPAQREVIDIAKVKDSYAKAVLADSDAAKRILEDLGGAIDCDGIAPELFEIVHGALARIAAGKE